MKLKTRARRSVATVLIALAALLVLLVVAPGPLRLLWDKLRPATPHQRYARALPHDTTARKELAGAWLAAAAVAVQRPTSVALPSTEELPVRAAQPVARGLAVTMKRGQALNVEVSATLGVPGHVFVDLFGPDADGVNDRPLASATEDSTAVTHEVVRSGTYVLRIQPDLVARGTLRITTTAGPSLSFPVARAGARNIQSRYGDERDAGRRRHEGVDIFATRGTPVLSASSGFVMTVGESRLGGRVVWIWDLSRGLRFYYAHLQDQHVSTGAFVHAGDQLGTVGNTGNAQTTPPHLHFGIYAHGEGAIDPEPFIRP